MLCELGQHGGVANEAGSDANSTFCSGMNSDYDYDRHHMDADDVAILDNGEASSSCKSEYRKPMSSGRRYCLTASIALCFLSVFAFVWMVPCNEEGICPAMVDRLKAHSWLHNYTKIEFKGGVNVVNGARRWEHNLVFLYRGDDFFPEFRPDNSKRNGIISLVGSTGAVAWFDEMSVEPMLIGCHLLDIDLNEQPDCLIVDKYGELSAINPVSGQWYWRSQERSARQEADLEFPLILPDLNGDGVGEILTVTGSVTSSKSSDHQPKEQRNCLRILSGRNGRPIGEGFKVRECDVVGQLQIDSPTSITFNCIRNATKAVRSKTLPELFALITNKSLIGKSWKTTMKYPEDNVYHHHHHQSGNPAESPKNGPRNVYSLSGRELLMDNRGNCPTNCNVTLILSENRGGKVHILYNFTMSAMYGMMPMQWHLQNSAIKAAAAPASVPVPGSGTRTHAAITGFVIKFWKWDNNDPMKVNNNNVHRSAIKKKDSAAFGNEILAKINDGSKMANKIHLKLKSDKMATSKPLLSGNASTIRSHHLTEAEEILQRKPRKTTNRSSEGGEEKHFSVSSYKMHSITESVILILFVGNETRIENISHSNVVQFCRNERNAVLTCQPSLANQANSVVIVDIDQDGSQELISFTSSFVQAPHEGEEAVAQDWRLVTYVRLLRIQFSDLSNLLVKAGGGGGGGGVIAGFTNNKLTLPNTGQNTNNNYNTISTNKLTTKNKSLDGAG